MSSNNIPQQIKLRKLTPKALDFALTIKHLKAFNDNDIYGFMGVTRQNIQYHKRRIEKIGGEKKS